MYKGESEANMGLTRHANVRCQQRGIPRLIVDWLLQYGTQTKASGGAETYFFDKRARRRIERDCGREIVRRLGDLLDAYLVIADDEIVTVGHRHKRIWRH
jgi:hypothetical protein